MSQGTRAEQLRQLLRLAKMLRAHIAETSDTHYAELFLNAADALEQRANMIARMEEEPAVRHIDILC